MTGGTSGSQDDDVLGRTAAGRLVPVLAADDAADAGARFIVAPGFGTKLVGYRVQHGIPVTPGTVTPGTVTPTDVQATDQHGLTTVKFFPAESFGGVKTIQALLAPFGQVRFVPIAGKRLVEITARTAAAVPAAKEARP